MNDTPSERPPGRRVGLWLLGARGAISTCVAYGLSALRQGLIEPIGLVTARPPFSELDLVAPEDLVLGGHDVCRRDLTDSAGELVEQGILSRELVAACASDAAAYAGRVRPGVLDEAEVGVADLLPESARLGAAPPREQIERIVADLRAFREAESLDRVVVVNLASAEPWAHARADWTSLETFDRALDAGRAQPVSMVYAAAAMRAGAPFVNFTPNRGASVAALSELARELRVPHCGNDGKTGETLVKTVLAPLFTARNLRVLAWQGYNMLGNRDGESLRDPVRRESKVQHKDDALREILEDPGVHTYVGIDYVPSLRDWKTALDYVHFEGFLGARMSLQFTWHGSDSALAAPLVVDLARLADFAASKGEFGEMEHVASFFKTPLGGGPKDFPSQFRALVEYARRHVAAARG